jgi:hypothetical protein
LDEYLVQTNDKEFLELEGEFHLKVSVRVACEFDREKWRKEWRSGRTIVKI